MVLQFEHQLELTSFHPIFLFKTKIAIVGPFMWGISAFPFALLATFFSFRFVLFLFKRLGFFVCPAPFFTRFGFSPVNDTLTAGAARRPSFSNMAVSAGNPGKEPFIASGGRFGTSF